MKKKAYLCMGWFSPEEEANYKLLSTILKQKYDLFEPRYEAGNLNEELEKRQNEILNDNTLSSEEKSNKLITIKNDVCHDIFMKDLHGIDDCDELFADISFRDTGGLVEIGYAIAKGKPIQLFDNSSRPKMNIMLASAAENCIRNETELKDFVNGEKVFDLGDTELE